MKQTAIRSILVLCAAFFLALFFWGAAAAGGYYHIVQKGDTLWDLCEKYYGDPWLWPKLWEMNPFITNPHLLSPGDRINLLEDVPLKRKAVKEETKHASTVKKEPEAKAWWARGLEISGLTNVKAIGYLSPDPMESCGQIISADTEHLILSERDKVVLRLEGNMTRPGDLIWVYKCSDKIKNPLNEEPLGYIVSILGNVKVTERIEGTLFKAVVNETYRDIRVGDKLTTYSPVSSCVVPTSAPQGLETTIMAVKDEHQIIGQFSVVYLEDGYGQGVQRGNLFEVIREREGLPDVVIGYVLVVDSRPDSSVGIVVEAKEHFYRGARLRTLQWEKAPRYLSAIPPCS